MSKSRRTIYRADLGRGGPVPPAVWAVGPWDACEFVAVRRDLDPTNQWTLTPHLSDAVDDLAAESPPPEVILVAQARPGVDDQDSIDRLQAAAPLARVIIVAGTWCEGELRTGKPPVGFARLYWHELPAWWRLAVTRRAAGLSPHWSGAVDRPASSRESTPPRTTVAVDAIDFSVFESLEAALRPEGFACTWKPRGRFPICHATAGIWDGAQLDDVEPAALTAFCNQFPTKPAPVIALIDYPRTEHLELARSCGAYAILGKPYPVESLVYLLTQSLPVEAMFTAPVASRSVETSG